MSIIKVIKISILILVVAIIGLLLVFIVNINTNNSIKTVDQTATNTLNMDDDIAYIIQIIAERNADWSILPLSDRFKAKFSNKYGILGKDDEYSKLYGSTNLLNKKKQIAGLVVFHEAKEEEYYVHYIVNDRNELDDVEIVDKILRYDENGKEVIYKETMNGAFVSNITQLAAPYRLDWDPFDYVYVTDHYLHKWGGGFIPYFEIDIKDENNAYISIEPYDIICNKEKHDVFFSAEYTYIENDGTPDAKLACDYIKYFRVHYITNEKAWLDDLEVEEISKEEIERLLKDK